MELKQEETPNGPLVLMPPRDFPEESYYEWPDYDEEVGVYEDLDDDFEFDWDEDFEIEFEFEQ